VRALGLANEYTRPVSGFVDLHCHWIPGIDDGAPDDVESLAILRGLRALGFERVIATPHMRPGLFDNDRAALLAAFAAIDARLEHEHGLPARGLGSEHFFDEIVLERLLAGQGVPYPGEHAVLVEFRTSAFPPGLEQRLAQISRLGLTPVIAHPERYQPLWQDPERLEPLLDAGAVALLDVAALAGKYGARPERSARELLERGLYHAACSDAHRAADLPAVERGMAVLGAQYGAAELEALLGAGPREILEGKVRH
jgi:protein-tyrosine phosphatase